MKQEDVLRVTNISLKNNLSYWHYGQGLDYEVLGKVFFFLSVDLDYTVPENKYLSFIGIYVYVYLIYI